MIKDEEDALEDYYQEYVQEANGHLAGRYVRCAHRRQGLTVGIQLPQKGFNPLIHSCADEISSALGNCWVAVKAESNNGTFPEYTVSIQPSEYTSNDVLLKLKSLGYAPTFKAIKDLESAVWAYFEVKSNGITFNLSSTVSAVDPPEPRFSGYDEPATDEELPF